MFTDLKPYREYQETVVDRFAGIPVNWEHKRLRYLFREVDVRSSAGTERPLSMSQRLGLVPAEDVQRSLSASSHVGGKLCLPGDMVLNRLKAHLGVFAVSQQSGVVSPDYTVLRTIAATDPTYFERLLRSEVLRTELRRRTKGIVEGFWRLYTDDFYDIVVPVPPADEQAAIVKYLGHANARINRAIASKRKLIALLVEQMQAIIGEAVTRGLDSTVPLKDSGIPWLGEIPTAWETSRLGWLISLQTGYPFESLGYTTDESAIRLLRGVNVGTGHLQWGDVVGWPSDGGALGNFALEVGDIVLGMDRPVISSGIRVTRVGVEDVPSLLVQRVARIRPAEDLLADYLMHLISGRAFADYLRPIFTGISVPHLSPQQISHFEIPVPPVAEQRRIVEILASATAGVNETRARANREIELLREFRTRLTAEVVTGQLDVREAAARLPELDLADLVSDVGQDEDDLDAEVAESLEQVDA